MCVLCPLACRWKLKAQGRASAIYGVGEPTHGRGWEDLAPDPLRWAEGYRTCRIVTWGTQRTKTMMTFDRASLAAPGASPTTPNSSPPSQQERGVLRPAQSAARPTRTGGCGGCLRCQSTPVLRPVQCRWTWQILPGVPRCLRGVLDLQLRPQLHDQPPLVLARELCPLPLCWALADGQPQPALGAVSSASQVRTLCTARWTQCRASSCVSPVRVWKGKIAYRIPPPESWHEPLLRIDVDLMTPLAFCSVSSPDGSGSHPSSATSISSTRAFTWVMALLISPVSTSLSCLSCICRVLLIASIVTVSLPSLVPSSRDGMQGRAGPGSMAAAGCRAALTTPTTDHAGSFTGRWRRRRGGELGPTRRLPQDSGLSARDTDDTTQIYLREDEDGHHKGPAAATAHGGLLLAWGGIWWSGTRTAPLAACLDQCQGARGRLHLQLPRTWGTSTGA